MKPAPTADKPLAEKPEPMHVKYPDLTEEEDERSLQGWFQSLTPEERIQSAINLANMAAGARRLPPDE